MVKRIFRLTRLNVHWPLHSPIGARPAVKCFRFFKIGSDGAVAHRGKDTLDRVRRAQMIPVFGREIEKSQQRIAILGQAGHGPFVLGAVFVFEPVQCGDRFFSRRGVVNVVEVRLHIGRHRLGKLVDDIADLVEPASLVCCLREHLLQGFPKTQGTIADGQVRRHIEPAAFQVDQQFAPALRAFPPPDLKADQFLLAFRRRADDDKHALGIGLHAGLKIDAIRPDVDIVPGRQIAPKKGLVVLLPARRQPRDDAWLITGCYFMARK